MPQRVLSRLPAAERVEVLSALRTETVGGTLLLAPTAIALIWANSPWQHAYEHLVDLHVGPSALHLRLSIEEWAQDGLLAVFFYVAGIELKRELVVGELRDPATAVLPVVAACCGVLLPVVCFFAIAAGHPEAANGWAVPTATDIAFALAVLAVVGAHLPASLRAFLLTLAVVDDLIAIVIIAVFYSDKLSLWPLLVGAALIGLFYALQRNRVRAWWRCWWARRWESSAARMRPYGSRGRSWRKSLPGGTSSASRARRHRVHRLTADRVAGVQGFRGESEPGEDRCLEEVSARRRDRRPGSASPGSVLPLVGAG